MRLLTADVSVTSISFLKNTGLLAVGFNFGCFQLWKLNIPVLEYVASSLNLLMLCLSLGCRKLFLKSLTW